MVLVFEVVAKRRRAAAVHGAFGAGIFKRAAVRVASARGLRKLTGYGRKNE